MVEAIISSIVGTGLLTTVINLIVTAHSEKKSKLKDMDEKLKKIDGQLQEIKDKQVVSEKDTLRTQLLLMISDYPDETMDILKLAEHYFKNLKGNWTATMLFNRWLESRKIAKPDWFHPQDHV